ncbi:MAG: phosphate ABC transporter, permease protein PstA, partial [Perlucidibaca sp.]
MLKINKRHLQRRKIKNAVLIGLATAVTLSGLMLPLWILVTVIERGIGSFNLDLFTLMTPPPEADGGLLNAIVGSFIMVGEAMLLASPVGIITGVYLA